MPLLKAKNLPLLGALVVICYDLHLGMGYRARYMYLVLFGVLFTVSLSLWERAHNKKQQILSTVLLVLSLLFLLVS